MTLEPTAARTSDDRSAERWYLRIDGQRYGPVGRAELENFLRPPRLCSVLEVKCGDDGEWVFITRDESIDKVLVKFGVEPDPVADPLNDLVPKQSRASHGPKFLEGTRDFFEGLAAWLVYHWVGVTAVIVIAAVNVAVLLALRDPHGRDREILARYEVLWKGVRGFASDTASEDWRKFTEPALADLEPIVRELEASANVHHPSRQNLLFAGRDHLRKILQGDRPPNERDPQVTLFERRMQAAQAQFSAGTAGTGKPLVKGPR